MKAKLFILLLLFSLPLFANPGSMSPSDLWLQWTSIAFIGLMLATAFAVLVYMLGHFLSSERMVVFGKMEIAEVIYSAVLIIAVMGILATATEAAGALITAVYPGNAGPIICGPSYDAYFGGDSSFPCHMRVARIYLDTLYVEGKLFNFELLSIHMWYSLFQNVGLSADFHEHASGSVQYSPLASAFSIPSSIYSYMFEIGMKSMVIIRFQQFFLNFINYSIYPVFVVLGLLLRTFPFSRRLGGLLMAIGISLFFIFPMFYVLGGIIFKNIADQSGLPDDPTKGDVITSLTFNPTEFYSKIKFVNEDESLLSGGASGVPGSNTEMLTEEYLKTTLYPSNVNYCQSADTGIPEGIDQVWDWVKMFFYAVDFTGLIVSNDAYIDSLIGPGGVIDATARFVFFSMFFGLLSVFSTLGAIRSLSPLLGGDIELAGLTHLI